ncbi:hypothetical protein FACS1894184_04960 [Clostridia bacterium]|nr:hypothetical protein FACS1894184_04960 [Clostridia bacterium]
MKTKPSLKMRLIFSSVLTVIGIFLIIMIVIHPPIDVNESLFKPGTTAYINVKSTPARATIYKYPSTSDVNVLNPETGERVLSAGMIKYYSGTALTILEVGLSDWDHNVAQAHKWAKIEIKSGRSHKIIGYVQENAISTDNPDTKYQIVTADIPLKMYELPGTYTDVVDVTKGQPFEVLGITSRFIEFYGLNYDNSQAYNWLYINLIDSDIRGFIDANELFPRVDNYIAEEAEGYLVPKIKWREIKF